MSIATTVPAVKSWYSDIEEDTQILCTHHFIPDVDPAPYAESFVDDDVTDNESAPFVEIVVEEDNTAINPEPSIEIVIDGNENSNEIQTTDNEKSTSDHERETLLV